MVVRFNKKNLKTLFSKNKIESIEKSPFFEKKENLKPHNILIIESRLDALSWKKSSIRFPKVPDAMIFGRRISAKL